jgi:hypothetical protein
MSDKRRTRTLRRAAAAVALVTGATFGYLAVASGAPGTSTAAGTGTAGVTGNVYVSPTGSDSNPGTAAAPGRAVQ